MSINLRAAIYNNVSGHDSEKLEATILDAINSGEEKMLPGLGVLFELLWKNSDENDKEEMLSNLEEGVQHLQ
ncbi:spore protein [Pontibacillus halophilus JSM 076056 = DSM 19796]|uniref:Small, acid-soluble spore protein I n=1 Tax=Pontibacillus halophilus JSM 076056 = DSM 19796 TaxID=1385510 RepID=A0A0A5GN49_9BACI|nr:small acid-soluble spore protein SspI [Pontibacillus halophilus]KGX93409.1 spore protein [Pontibacillus halophilus JSM 076056 = DSM 19796]